jgi:hypothetical protein
MWDRYLTDFPHYQAMVGYIKAVYTPGDNPIVVGEEEDIEDLDYLVGWFVDSDSNNNMRKEK